MDRLILANGQIQCADGRTIELTASEAVLLGCLWKHNKAHPGECVPRQRQAVWLWGAEYQWPDTWASSIAVHYHRLKSKIGGCSFTVEHKYGYGDRFVGELAVDGDLPGREEGP